MSEVMNLYHLARETWICRGENVALVIAASSEDEARRIAAGVSDIEGPEPWLERAVAVWLGVANPGVETGVICIDCAEARVTMSTHEQITTRLTEALAELDTVRAALANEPTNPGTSSLRGTQHDIWINKTTVTVETGYSLVDRIPHKRIVEVRHD